MTKDQVREELLSHLRNAVECIGKLLLWDTPAKSVQPAVASDSESQPDDN